MMSNDAVKKEIQDYESHWHLDKRVPIAIILSFLGTVMLQSVLAAYAYGKLAERVEHNEQSIISLQNVVPEIYRMSANMESMRKDISEMNNNNRILAERLWNHYDSVSPGTERK